MRAKKQTNNRSNLRYKRSDIDVELKTDSSIVNYVELINISQDGMSICLGEKLKMKKNYTFYLGFSGEERFKLKGEVVNKVLDLPEEDNIFKKIVSRIFAPETTAVHYGIELEDRSDFKSYLLTSNMKRRLNRRSVFSSSKAQSPA